MGVDFFPCDRCGDSICDFGDYIRCNDECGRWWCGLVCARGDGFRRDGEDGEDEGRSCNYCRGENVDAAALVLFLLDYTGLSKADAVRLYGKWGIGR